MESYGIVDGDHTRVKGLCDRRSLVRGNSKQGGDSDSFNCRGGGNGSGWEFRLVPYARMPGTGGFRRSTQGLGSVVFRGYGWEVFW